jgi:hypothetical protein
VRRFAEANVRDQMFHRFGAAAAILFAAFLPVAASPQPRCSQETLAVRGTPVTVGYCVTSAPQAGTGEEVGIPVAASYGAPGGSFARTEVLRFIAGEDASRVVENLKLDRLGMPGQILHLTLVYSGGLVHVEGALLTPGAITIK